MPAYRNKTEEGFPQKQTRNRFGMTPGLFLVLSSALKHIEHKPA